MCLQVASLDAYSHWFHLFFFSPVCVFKCFLKLPASDDAYSHWLHLFDCSPLCLFKLALKLLLVEQAYSHKWHLFDSMALLASFIGISTFSFMIKSLFPECKLCSSLSVACFKLTPKEFFGEIESERTESKIRQH